MLEEEVDGGWVLVGGLGTVVLERGMLVLLVLLVLVVGGTAYLLWKKGLYWTSVCGAEKFFTGKSDSAGFIKAAQISAGKLPPCTWIPWTSVMGTFPCG